MRIAAIGCSHTSGYHVDDMPEAKEDMTQEHWPYSGKWNNNNWAEHYINSKDADGVIFANPQNGWWTYSEWLSHLFKTYDDIKEVVVQMTYWNRFRLSIQFPTHYENIVPLDATYVKELTKGRIDCWYPANQTNDGSVNDIPMQVWPMDFQKEVPFKTKNSITVMAVDNLPCELPKDASEGFGTMFFNKVLPAFFNDDKDGILHRAKITTAEGTLTDRFSYLQEYVDGQQSL